MFSGVYWNYPVCTSFHVSVCVQNNSLCQITGGGIKSHLVATPVEPKPVRRRFQNVIQMCKVFKAHL